MEEILTDQEGKQIDSIGLEKQEAKETVKWAKDSGYSDEEISDALEHGLLRADQEEDTEVKKDIDDDNKGDNKDARESHGKKAIDEAKNGDDELEEIRNSIKDGVELTADQEKRIHELSRDEKGFYFRAKKERNKRQLREKENEFLRSEKNALEERLRKIEEDFNSSKEQNEEEPDSEEILTRGQLEKELKRRELDSKNKNLNSEKEITRQQAVSKLITNRIDALASERRIIDPNYDKMEKLFAEMVQRDTSGRIQNKLQQKASTILDDPDAEDEIMEYVYRVAKKHEKYNDVIQGEKKLEIERAEKAIRNSKKEQASAKVTGGNKKSFDKSEEDLTLEDIGNFTIEQVGKLSKGTYKRLMME